MNTTRHIADMHFVYGLCNGNARAAVREYQRRYPNRPIPNHQTFSAIHARLAEYGIRRPQGERNPSVSEHSEEAVLNLIVSDPRLSVRRISTRLEISRWTVWKILKKEGLHPYHLRRVQDIREPDNAARSVFCMWVTENMRRKPAFLKRIMWTDEASFTRRGITNFRNLHLWMAENPHAVRPSTYQHEFSVNGGQL